MTTHHAQMSWLAALALSCSAAVSCRPATTKLPGPPRTVADRFFVVAEGPCAKLAVRAVGQRRFVVFGDTGYELGAWNAGERLAAAQSIVEIREGQAFRIPGLMRGLPTNSGGYVPGDVTLGGSSVADLWLLHTTTRYAPAGAGALFERTDEPYTWEGTRWQKQPSADIVRFPAAAKSLPPLPIDTMCQSYDPGLHYVRVTSATLPSGHVWIAGRCEDRTVTNFRNPTLLVAHGAPGATEWDVTALPDTAELDGILNLDIHARGPRDVYLVAYEPFLSLEDRHPYLAHYDGEEWTIVGTPIRTGMTAVAGSADGTLWVAAGGEVWRRDAQWQWRSMPLPPLLFAKPARPETLRITAVHAFAVDDVWLEGAYRVELPAEGEHPAAAVRASVLYGSQRTKQVLYCDPSRPVPDGLTTVDVPAREREGAPAGDDEEP